jgi:hypothetical protein
VPAPGARPPWDEVAYEQVPLQAQSLRLAGEAGTITMRPKQNATSGSRSNRTQSSNGLERGRVLDLLTSTSRIPSEVAAVHYVAKFDRKVPHWTAMFRVPCKALA